MNLRDMNPEVISDRVLWFDCPLHEPSGPCQGRIGVRLNPPLDGAMGSPDAWSWSGDWSTWTISLVPSIIYDRCGLHIGITAGVISNA